MFDNLVIGKEISRQLFAIKLDNNKCLILKIQSA